MRPFTRAERVGGQIQKVLSDLLLRQIKDPRLEMTTITAVKMSSDLKTARIYFSTSSGEKRREEALQGYKHAGGYVKRILARELRLRYMPELQFFYDDSFDYSMHIEKIIQSLKTENGPHHPPSEE